MSNELTRQAFLTTFDNPFNPFTHFDEWLLFDNEKGYDCCGKVARIAKYSNDMSEEEKIRETNRAIDRILEIDFLGIYEKIFFEDSKEQRIS